MTMPVEWLESFASRAIDEGLVDAVYGEVDSSLGKLLVVQTEAGICRISYLDEPKDDVLAHVARIVGGRVVASRAATKEASDALTGYLSGQTTAFDLPVDLSLVASPWQRAVLEELGRVERGTVTTYGRIARRTGHPGAARATGTALARNPVPIVVPCHRVLPSSGVPGGYAGGPERKRWLLDLEGVSRDDFGRYDPGAFV